MRTHGIESGRHESSVDVRSRPSYGWHGSYQLSGSARASGRGSAGGYTTNIGCDSRIDFSKAITHNNKNTQNAIACSFYSLCSSACGRGKDDIRTSRRKHYNRTLLLATGQA